MENLFEPLFAACGAAVPCLMFGAVATLIAVGIIYGIIKARQRREAMARLAAELGLQYYPDDPWDLPGRYAQFEVFNTGHARRASNVMAGPIDGHDVLIFDYRYTTGSGKNQTTHHHQIAILELPILAARLRMRRENVFDKIASWVGHDDLDFESAEFSRLYHVKCATPKFAYDVLHARLIDYLLKCGDVPALEMAGPLLILTDSQRDMQNVRRLLGIGRQIITSLPEYLLKDRGGAGTA